MEKRNSTALKRRMEGRWLSAFLALAPALETAVNKLGKNVPCPIDGGTDGFRLFRDAAFGPMGLHSITALLPPDRANRKAILRLGFVEEGPVTVDGAAFVRFRLHGPRA